MLNEIIIDPEPMPEWKAALPKDQSFVRQFLGGQAKAICLFKKLVLVLV